MHVKAQYQGGLALLGWNAVRCVCINPRVWEKKTGRWKERCESAAEANRELKRIDRLQGLFFLAFFRPL